jgi:hypothetical protein
MALSRPARLGRNPYEHFLARPVHLSTRMADIVADPHVAETAAHDAEQAAADRSAAVRHSRAKAAKTRWVSTVKRGGRLGAVIDRRRAEGVTSNKRTAVELNIRGIRGANGGEWTAVSVKRLLGYIAEHRATRSADSYLDGIEFGG